ncbi:hypothetical protein BH23VER1_BH23VER1_05110 [soil metagenome]
MSFPHQTYCPVSIFDEPIPKERQEAAALYATGVLGDRPRAEFEEWLRSASPEASRAVAELCDVAALAAATMALDAGVQPSAELRGRVLEAVADLPQDRRAAVGGAAFSFLMAGEGDWREAPFRGVRYKELSAARGSGFVVILGDLAPGARIPGHYHRRAEEVYVLSGDLCTHGRELGAGDYMRAAAGTTHGTAISKNGCRAIVIMGEENYPKRALGMIDKVSKGFRKIFSKS